jgi:hypothetical protein
MANERHCSHQTAGWAERDGDRRICGSIVIHPDNCTFRLEWSLLASVENLRRLSSFVVFGAAFDSGRATYLSTVRPDEVADFGEGFGDDSRNIKVTTVAKPGRLLESVDVIDSGLVPLPPKRMRPMLDTQKRRTLNR